MLIALAGLATRVAPDLEERQTTDDDHGGGDADEENDEELGVDSGIEQMIRIRNSATLKELKAKLPIEVFEKIRLAEQAKLAKDFDETVTLLLKKGLSAVAPDIKKGLIQQLNEFETL